MRVTGVAVQVQSAFDGRWVEGFDVVEVFHVEAERHFVLRRRSDGAVLPTPLPEDRVRSTSGETIVV